MSTSGNEDWFGLYGEGWTNEIVPEAFKHPAKFSRGLIRRIYDHMLAESWIKPGDTCIDPFGGVALGALDAMRIGVNWIGIELESSENGGSPFVELGNQNIALWNERYGSKLPRWATAKLIQGDSRELSLDILLDASISSPPFNENKNNVTHGESKGFHSHDENEAKNRMKRDYILPEHPDNLGNMAIGELDAAISSPPYSDTLQTGVDKPRESDRQHKIAIGRNPDSPGSFNLHDYGNTDGQLGSMKGDGFDAALSSPPYAESLDRGRVDPEARRDLARSQGISNAEYISPIEMEKIGKRDQEYGETEGQLGGMKSGDFDGAVSSPPYENIEIAAIPGSGTDVELRKKLRASGEWEGYNRENDTNAGNLGGNNFWLAARQIVDNVYAVLRPGGHVVWVVKSYVKDKQRVDFPGQWQQLCEAVGFKTVHVHRAWLIEDKGTQIDLFGNSHTKTVARKSFFRRLAEFSWQSYNRLGDCHLYAKTRKESRMKSYDEIKEALSHLEVQFTANSDRQSILKQSTRAVDWNDSEEGQEFELLQEINEEIAAVMAGMTWVIDDLGNSPRSQRVEQVMSPREHILHAGEI